MHRRVKVGALDALGKLADQRQGDAVAAIWPVERDPSDALFDLVGTRRRLSHPDSLQGGYWPLRQGGVLPRRRGRSRARTLASSNSAIPSVPSAACPGPALVSGSG